MQSRNQIRGLRAQHQQDITKLKDLLKSDKIFPKTTETSDENLIIKPIGIVSTWHQTKNGTPRQPTIAKMANGIIDLSVMKTNFHPGMENPQFSLEGLESFSHIWIIFHFHQNSQDGKPFLKTKVNQANPFYH